MDEQATARMLLTALQASVDAKDIDGMTALFHAEGVLVGTRRYNYGLEAVRTYLVQEVVEMADSLYWDLPDLDVFLSRPDAIGFSGDGRITVTTPDGDVLQFAFRLTVVAEQADDAWLIRHFHGSLPSAN